MNIKNINWSFYFIWNTKMTKIENWKSYICKKKKTEENDKST